MICQIMILLILFLMPSVLLTSCVATQTTFQKDILDKLEDYSIYELSMFVFKEPAENIWDVYSRGDIFNLNCFN